MTNLHFKCLKIGLIGILTIIMGGCFLANKNPPSQREQQCTSLKNQLVFDNADYISDTATNKDATATIMAKTMKEYDEKHCQDFETNKNPTTN